MRTMSLAACLDLKRNRVVSFYGAGGKTTLMHRLASELAALGKRVLVTTTTRIYPHPAHRIVFANNAGQVRDMLQAGLAKERICIAAAGIDEGKLIGFEPRLIDELKELDDFFILVEADGSKGKSLKGFAFHEPVIPASSDLIVPLAGLDALGGTHDHETVHRLPELLALTGAKEGEMIGERHIASYFNHAVRLGSAQAPGAAIIPALNKSDLLTNPAFATWTISSLLTDVKMIKSVIAVRVAGEMPVKAIFPFIGAGPEIKITAVILAAGRAARMGRDKLSLQFGEKTILEQTLDNVRSGGIEDIVIVIQPGSHWPAKINYAGVRFTENPDYHTGQASSVKAALNALDPYTQAAMFVLADQPMVEPDIYRQLAGSYRGALKPVTCPVFNGARGNPAIFDRILWPELALLSGDTGGRAIISELPGAMIDPVPVRSPSVLQDIDTGEDYKQHLSGSNNRKT